MTPQEKQELNSRLLKAARDNSLADTKACLAQGADINTTDQYGNNALIYVARYGWPGLAELLIDSGINKDHQNVDGRTALIEAVIARNVMTAKALLSRQVDTNLRDDGGRAALHYALDAGHSEVLATWLAVDIIKAGGDPNLKDANGTAPLIKIVSRAAAWPVREDYILEALVEAGAHIRAKDDKGLTAIDHALSHGLEEAAHYLRTSLLKQEAVVYRKGLPHPVKAPKVLRFKP
jgi:ankyrin repeat protein